MRKLFFIGFFMAAFVGLVGLMTQPPSTPTAQAAAIQAAAVQNQMVAAQLSTPSPMSYATPTPDARLNAEMTLLFIHATDTQISIAKTEQAFYDMQSTKAEEQRIQAEQAAAWTQQASWAMTQTATQIQGQQTVNAGYAFATQTVQATQTAGIQTAGAGFTATSLAATQVIERDAFIAKRLRIYGGTILLLGVISIVITIGVIFAGVKIWNVYLDGKGRFIQDAKIVPDKDGRFPAVPAGAIGNDKLINLNLAHRAVTDPNKDDLTAEQALANTQSQRDLEAARAFANSPLFQKQMQRKPSLQSEITITKPQVPELLGDQPLLAQGSHMPNMPLPEWARFNDWDGKQMIYGVGRRGEFLLADPKEEPHWLVVGRTRSFKSRGGVRTLTTAALTMGFQVLFIGKRVDFFPFENHPNAKIVAIDLLNEPLKYLETLKKVAALMKQRDDYLTSKRMSIWQQTGRPQLYVVLDEFSAAVKQLNSVKSGAGNLVSTMATALIQESGKYGINIIQVVQDATGSNVDVSARRNMGKLVFRLSEKRASEVALGVSEPSAVALPNRYFLSSIGENANITLGVAFAPSDQEVESFLRQRPVQELEPMDWIEGEVLKDTEPVPAAVRSFVPEIEMLAEPSIDDKIREILDRMIQAGNVSLRQAEKEAYGTIQGGARYNKVSEIYKQLRQPTTDKGTTDGTTDGKMPESGPLAA